MRAFAIMACLMLLATAKLSLAREREQIVDYRNGQLVSLRLNGGHPVTVHFPTGEKIAAVTVSDTANWHAELNHARTRLVVQGSLASGVAMMTVSTDRGTYTFGLNSFPETGVQSEPTIVRVRAASNTQSRLSIAAGGSADAQPTTYQIRGAMELRPSYVSDDGVRTYIDWPADAPLPAVYSIDEAGREALTNGNMRSGRFVIDSVEKHLLFRLDRRVASAIRLGPQARRR